MILPFAIDSRIKVKTVIVGVNTKALPPLSALISVNYHVHKVFFFDLSLLELMVHSWIPI